MLSPEELPKPAKKLAESFGEVIVYVTRQSMQNSKTDVRCWSKFNKNQCLGAIDAVINLQTLDILWKCQKCGDQGSISNWAKYFMGLQ